MSSEPSATTASIDLLGAPSERDRRLDPAAHAGRLHAAAGPLRRILETERVREIVRRYDQADRDAAEQQTEYRRLGRWEIELGAAAAVLGAIVLLLAPDAREQAGAATVVRVLLAVQVLCAAGVAVAKFRTQHRQPYVAWQQARSIAESARIELFETVCGLVDDRIDEDPRPGEATLLPLQLAYFVRYQYDVQDTFYDRRGAEHRAAAERFVDMASVLVFGSAVTAAIVGTSWDAEVGGVAVAALAALVLPILVTAHTNRSRLHEDERNAARYRITLGHLRRARGGLLDAARRGADAGDPAPVHAFIRAVDEVISIEHKEWQAAPPPEIVRSRHSTAEGGPGDGGR